MNRYRIMGDFSGGALIVDADDFTVTGSPRILAFQKKAQTEDEPEGIEVVAMFLNWTCFYKLEGAE